MVALFLFLVLPVLELWTAILVAQWIGVLPTLLLLVGFSVLGFVLIRSEGLSVWRKANAELAAGRQPTDSLLDGLMVVVGGVLLIVPGFLTAVPGLLLLFPPTRALLRPVVARWIERRAARSAAFVTASFGGAPLGSFGGSAPGAGPSRRSWRGRVVDAESHEAPDSTGASYAEVIDVEVDGSRELDPPR
ncbi:FxsA family protein [Dermatobacter hominis]|uniref:FxsA family protein n=1 Tax=Dermatobacter hominis TaxID=2884263 RepID=UPI001D0F9171|nr:FxsA family protein [Dermatobacter hominis]UDY34394.1 FxsA family protein [Dermatobacter hominis]